MRAWILLGICLKLLLYLFLIEQAAAANPGNGVQLFFVSGDEASYVVPAENLLRTGDYAFDVSNPWSRMHRMPGYAWAYCVMRLALPPNSAKAALILLQVILGGLAVALLAALAYSVRRRRLTFVLAGSLSGFSVVASIWDLHFLPDGLATSLLVVVAWCAIRARSTVPTALAAGSLAAWSVFMRPFFAPLVPLLAFCWYWRCRKESCTTRRATAVMVASLLPLMMMETAWIVRNYYWVGAFVPVHTAGFNYSRGLTAARTYVLSFGGDFVWWRPNTFSAWLEPGSPFHDPSESPPLPPSALSERCNIPDLVRARRLLTESRQATGGARDALDHAAAEIFDACRAEYVRRHWLDHQVIARLRLLRQFLVHAGPVLPFPAFSAMAPLSPQWCFKLVSVGLYGLVCLTGFIWLPFLLIRERSPGSVLLAGIPLFFLVLFPLVLRFVETRYLAGMYPFLCGTAAIAMTDAFQHLRRPEERSRGGQRP